MNHKIVSHFPLLGGGVELWQKLLSAMDTPAQSILKNSYCICKERNSHLFKLFFLAADLVVLLVMSVLSEMLGSEVLFFWTLDCRITLKRVGKKKDYITWKFLRKPWKEDVTITAELTSISWLFTNHSEKQTVLPETHPSLYNKTHPSLYNILVKTMLMQVVLLV